MDTVQDGEKDDGRNNEGRILQSMLSNAYRLSPIATKRALMNIITVHARSNEERLSVVAGKHRAENELKSLNSRAAMMRDSYQT